MNTAAHGGAPGEAVVADYLANRLSDAEAQEFENYCLEHPEFARDVERDLALKTGLRQAYQPIAQVGTPVRRRRYARWPAAISASVAMLICAVLIIQKSIVKQPSLVAFTSAADLPESLRRAEVSQATLIRMRGKEEVTQVSTVGNAVVEIRLLPDVASQSGNYSVKISAESVKSIEPLTVGHLKPASDGYLRIYLPSRQMIGQTWLISLAGNGDSSESPSQIYRLRIVTAPMPAG